MSLEAIIFYFLLIDSVGCNLVVWFGAQWYTKHLNVFGRFFPPAKGWATYYLVLVLWLGWIMYGQGMLF